MKKEEDKHYVFVSVKKFYPETSTKNEYSKKLPIKEGQCDIDIGLNFNLFIVEQQLNSIQLFFASLPLEIAETFSLKDKEEKIFKYDFDNIIFECTITCVL